MLRKKPCIIKLAILHLFYRFKIVITLSEEAKKNNMVITMKKRIPLGQTLRIIPTATTILTVIKTIWKSDSISRTQAIYVISIHYTSTS